MKYQAYTLMRIRIVLPVMMALTVLGGCYSTILAPKLTEAEQEFASTFKTDAVVGIQLFKHKVYSDRLIVALRETNLFREVHYIDSLSQPPDITASVTRSVYGAAVIPIVPCVTLGLVPQAAEEEHGNAFSLEPTHLDSVVMDLDCTFKGTSYLGWVAILMNLSSNRSFGNAESTPRYQAQLRYQIAQALSEHDLRIFNAQE